MQPGLVELRAQGLAVGAGLQSHVNARELAAPLKQVLRGAQVHHSQGRAAGGHAACPLDAHQPAAALQLQLIAWQALARGGIQKHGGRCKQGKAGGLRVWPGHERRRHPGHAQRIQAQHLQVDFLPAF